MNLAIDRRIERGAGSRRCAGNGDARWAGIRVYGAAEIFDVVEHATSGKYDASAAYGQRFAFVANVTKEHAPILPNSPRFYERA
jgi:hypothetical protein